MSVSRDNAYITNIRNLRTREKKERKGSHCDSSEVNVDRADHRKSQLYAMT